MTSLRISGMSNGRFGEAEIRNVMVSIDRGSMKHAAEYLEKSMSKDYDQYPMMYVP